MSKKPIKIDLSTFFDDERKEVFILVDSSWESVACLQRRVEHLFDVDSVRFLSDGCFLPPQESIEILQFFKHIKAFVPKESLEIRKHRKLKKIKIGKSSGNSENEEAPIADYDKQLIVDLKKKRKSTCLESNHSSSSLLSKPKRSKTSHNNSLLEIINAKNKIPQPLQVVDEFENKMSTTKDAYIPSDYDEFKEDNPSYGPRSKIREKRFEEKAIIVSENSDDQYKQSHTSTPKENNNKSTLSENDLKKTFNDELKKGTSRPTGIPSSTFLSESVMVDQRDNAHCSSKPLNPSNPFKKAKSGGSHIYFNETGSIVNSTTKRKSKSISKKDKEPKPIITFRSLLSDVTNGIESEKPRIFLLKSKNITNSTTKKEIVEIQEDIILQPLSIQKARNYLSLTNENTATNGVDKSSLKSTTIATGITIIAKNYHEEQVSAKDLQVSQNEELNRTATQSESQMELITHIETENESQLELSNIDGDVIETQNESQVELSSIDGNVTETCNESQVEPSNVDESVTEAQNESQVELSNIDGDVTEAQSESQVEPSNIDEGVTEAQNESQMEITEAQNASQVELSSIDGSVTETQNESQVDPSNIDKGVTETQNESQLEISNVDGDDVEGTHNDSQVDLTNIDRDVTERQDVSQMKITHVDKDVGELEKKTKVGQENIDETRITPVDCVDLSNDVDEDSKLEDIVEEKLDLTADDESNESDVEEISEIIDLNESQDNCNSTISTENNSAVKQRSVKDILPFSIDLKELPNVEDTIIFKVPYTEKNNKIVNTDFMAGKVEYINKRTKSIKISIMDGASELCHVPNQLIFCNMDDTQNYVKYLQLKLTDMREAKLFSRF